MRSPVCASLISLTAIGITVGCDCVDSASKSRNNYTQIVEALRRVDMNACADPIASGNDWRVVDGLSGAGVDEATISISEILGLATGSEVAKLHTDLRGVFTFPTSYANADVQLSISASGYVSTKVIRGSHLPIALSPDRAWRLRLYREVQLTCVLIPQTAVIPKAICALPWSERVLSASAADLALLFIDIQAERLCGWMNGRWNATNERADPAGRALIIDAVPADRDLMLVLVGKTTGGDTVYAINRSVCRLSGKMSAASVPLDNLDTRQ